MSANLGERPAGKRSVALIILGSVVGLMALAFVSVGVLLSGATWPSVTPPVTTRAPPIGSRTGPML